VYLSREIVSSKCFFAKTVSLVLLNKEASSPSWQENKKMAKDKIGKYFIDIEFNYALP
jgi:hypothetical protein